jgi:alkanesulfonate monooxygenase
MSGLPALEAQFELCRQAEESGIDSVLMAIGFTRPDPLLLSVVLGIGTETIKFMVACRAGLVTPTYFVQQINSLSALIGGRVHVNMVAGHTPHELGYYGDFLDHDARFDRLDEFLAICRGLWEHGEIDFEGVYYKIRGGRINTRFSSPTATVPELYIGGSSAQPGHIAARHRACLWRLAQEPERFREETEGLVARGTEVGVLVSLIARPTRAEALRAAETLIAPLGEAALAVHRGFAAASDSVGFRSTYEQAGGEGSPWRGRCLWAGAVPYLGAPAIALVGSAAEVADALLEYKRAGASQFLFMGWPDAEEMCIFGAEVLPLVRDREARELAELTLGSRTP